MLIHGRCHCGNISFRLDWRPDPIEIPARVCDCSFCQKHQGAWTSNPEASLEVEVAQASKVSKYAFGSGTALFHVCARCGVVPVVTSDIEGRTYAVVSVNAFDGAAASLLRRTPTSFEGEEVASRLRRRTRNWIADVKFIEHREDAP
jgi:hypothetical protein